MTNLASSGGASTLFEAKVGASYFLSMLLEVDARGLPGCHIESVRLQRGQEGHPLDDIVVSGVDHNGEAAILETQVKRAIREFSRDRIAFRHDVLREWAIANLFFEERGFAWVADLKERASPDGARAAELAARMALGSSDGVPRWQELVISLEGSHETWRRAVVLALIRSEDAAKLLVLASSLLMADDVP